MPNIKLKGKVIEYTVRESNRAKHISLRVRGKDVEVVYPTGVKRPKPRNFLRENMDWLLKTLHKIENPKGNYFHRDYKQGEVFTYLGQEYKLNIIKVDENYIRTALEEETLDVSIPSTLSPESALSNIAHAVENFYRLRAKAHIPKRTYDLADKLGFEFNRIFIKNQKTKWGSCSSNRNLNFNLRLMMASPEAIDYIIIHELCHLVHLDHSDNFWKLLRKHCPEYQYWREWFKQNGQFLVL